MISRRHFVLVLAALTAPLAAHGQQANIKRISVLSLINPGPFLGFFRDALREHGYVEKNSQIDVRSADGNQQLLEKLAADIVRNKPDVIVAYQTPAVVAAQKVTRTIPIIMAPAGDPVGSGLVASLSKPGGNVTGMSGSTGSTAAKTLELVRDILPQAKRVGVLANANDRFTKSFVESMNTAGKKLRMQVDVAMVHGGDNLESVFRKWRKSGIEAVVVQPSLPRKQPIELALRYRLPSLSPSAPYAIEGGLMSYANSTKEIGTKSAKFVDRILKGANPAELPVEEPTIFELTVNAKTARELSISFPPSIVARADRVVQ